MHLAKTRVTVLKNFEQGIIDTPKGAFIGSLSVASISLLLSAIASEVVPVCRQDELNERFVLAESDAFVPAAWARACLPFQKTRTLPTVMEWRCPGLPALFTVTSGWHRSASLRSSPGQTLACAVSGYRYCDPTQVRMWNGVVYRKSYRGWRPVRDLNRAAVPLDTLLSLARTLGMEVESGFRWTLSRWLQTRLDRSFPPPADRRTSLHSPNEATHTAA